MPHATSPLDPVATAIFGATGAALLSHVPVNMVFGAFAGATLYLVGRKDKPTWQWVLMFWMSFMAGLMGGAMVCQIVQGAFGLLKIKVTMPTGLGAMAAGALTVNAISYLRDNPKSLIFWKKTAEETQS